MFKISIDEQDFKSLINGDMVIKDGSKIQICLKDIGYVRMKNIISDQQLAIYNLNEVLK